MEKKNIRILVEELTRIVSRRCMNPGSRRYGLSYEEHRRLGFVLRTLYSGARFIQTILVNCYGKHSASARAMEAAAAGIFEAKELLCDCLYKEHPKHCGFPSFYGSSLYDDVTSEKSDQRS